MENSKRSPFMHYYFNDEGCNIEMQGSFTNALYHLWFKADASNKRKLLAGFPDFFSEDDYEYFCGKSTIMESKKITKEEIKRLALEEGLMITDLIDVVIEVNSIIGVGLISLADGLSDYIRSKIK